MKMLPYDKALHWGREPMDPEHAVEVWRMERGLVQLMGGLPNAEVRTPNGKRYRNDERGRLWVRVSHSA